MWLPRMSVTNTGVNYNQTLPRLSLPLHTLAFVEDGSAIPTNEQRCSSMGSSTNSSLA